MRRSVVATLLFSLGGAAVACHHDTSSTGPNPGPVPLGYRFTPDPGVRVASGTQPAPLVVNGAVLLYLTTGNAPNTVLRATDGLNFTPVAASYPVATCYSFVTLANGQFRMYYMNATTGVVGSAVSTDGLNWTTESGVRIVLPPKGAPKVLAIPDTGYRMFYTSPGPASISTAFSTDGLTFVPEAGFTVFATDTTDYADPAPAFINGGAGGDSVLMAHTEYLVGQTAYSTLWLAIGFGLDAWVLDSAALLTDPSHSLSQPALVPVANGFRIYYTSSAVQVDSVTVQSQGQILSGLVSK